MNNNDSQSDNFEELDDTMSQIEASLNGVLTNACDAPPTQDSTPQPVRGVSGRRSLGNALQNLRRRVTTFLDRSRTGAASTRTSSSNTPLVTRSQTPSTTRSPATVSDLSERLRLAELAHSTRTPLGRLQSELHRRQQQEPSATTTMSVSTEVSQRNTSGTIPIASNPNKRPRESSLLASRARSTSTRAMDVDSEGDSSGQERNQGISDERLHRRLSKIRVLSENENCSMEVSSGFDSNRAVIFTRVGSSDEKNNTKKPQSSESEMDIEIVYLDHDIPSKEPETNILLTDDSSQKLDEMHRSVLFRSTSSSTISMDLDLDGSSTEQHQLLPQVYSWGVTTHSLYDTKESGDPDDLEPIGPSSRVGRTHVVGVATSCDRTALVTNSGTILGCGWNSSGAVDPSKPLTDVVVKPTLLESVTVPVLQVSCGMEHTAAVTTTGTVLSWGHNQHGQLGHRTPQRSLAKRHLPQAMALGRRWAASVACGDGFTLVLTTRMQVLACGIESIAGYSKSKDGDFHLPAHIPELFGLPITKIAAGAKHAAVVTCHGTAFVWGDNRHGQCGQEYPKELNVPVPIRMSIEGLVKTSSRITPLPPPDIAIVDAACGNAHTVLVTKKGQLMVCGSNEQGQLGIPREESSVENYLKVIAHPEPDGRFVTAVAGDSHALVLDDQQDVWLLGVRQDDERKDAGAPIKCVLKDRSIVAIAAGGSHCVAVSALPVEAIPPQLPAPVHRRFPRQLSNTSSTDSAQQLDNSSETRLIQHSVEYLVEAVGQQEPLQVQQQQQPSTIPLSEKAVSELANRAEELLQAPGVLNGLFLNPMDLDRLYRQVLNASSSVVARQRIASAIEKGMFQGLESLETESGHARLKFPESVRFLLLYLQCPLFSDVDDNEISFDRRGDLTLLLCEAFLGLSYEGYMAMVSWVTSLYPREEFVRCLVKPLLRQLERGLAENAGPVQRVVPLVVAVLKWLYVTSDRAGGIAKADDFWSKAVAGRDPQEAFSDLKRWKKSSKKERSTNFFLCSHSFLFSPATKRNLLTVENQIGMITTAAREGVTYNVAEQTMEINPFWVLEIEREHLLKQTLQKISQAKATDLRKKLKVVFKGEEGVDAGGVTREFFQLLSAQLFDINSGMWSDRFDEENITWFNSDCFWNDEGYYLVGILVGLAVYNSVLLDVNFPLAVYRKLLGLPLGLEDLIDARLQKSLQQLLEYEGEDVEDVFCLTFSVDWMDLGTQRTVEFKPGGSDLPVTSNNKEEYVRLYVKWLLVESIHPQYDAFERGFMKVMEHSTLDFMSPEELELLVVGSPVLDLSALEDNTTYEGYEKDAPVIQHLWSFVKNAPEETKVQFLRFATGASRAPIGGLGQLPFKVQRNGGDSMQLPTSHTCFNTLLLPDYGDNYDRLAERLGRAVLECEGFGLE